LRTFVDKENGGIFDAVNLKGKPITKSGKPKHWAWKSGFHEFEHALVAYITSSQFEGKPLRLHYALVQELEEDELNPYFYRARLDSLTDQAPGLQVATFNRITFP